MKLSISNIGWDVANDTQIYKLLQRYGYIGLEIAPTRIFPETPYEKLAEAKRWSEKMRREYGFVIPSMQSIWYGRTENMFCSEQEREVLIDYTKKAIDFATAIRCENLVFGCPRNRNISDGADKEVAIAFFREIGDYAASSGTVIGMEANPPIYNTNYINDTLSALALIEKVNSKGFLLNLDVGTMIQNEEDVSELVNRVNLINHIHISEPGLKIIEQRKLHSDLKELLEKENYNRFISIEMGKQENITVIERTLEYVKEVFD